MLMRKVPAVMEMLLSSLHVACSLRRALMPNRPEDYCAQEHAKNSHPTRHFSILFTTFVLMQLFNQVSFPLTS